MVSRGIVSGTSRSRTMALSSSLNRFLARERRPGDLVFAIAFFLFALFLLSQLGEQTQWTKRTKFFAQPAFWPAVGLIGMCVFGLGHAVGSFVSRKHPGRAQEILLWGRALEYAVWFMAYVWVVPIIGYLPATLLFTVSLTYRLGYRGLHYLAGAATAGIVIVVVFKSFLSVKIPGGSVYEYLPDGLRNFMLINF